MNNMTWDIMSENRMIVGVWINAADKKIGRPPDMRMFVGEIIENAGRKGVMKHVKECDNSPWLPNWKEEYHKTFDALSK